MRRLRWLLYFTIAVLNVLLLSACGGSGGGQGPVEVGAEAPDFTLPNATGGEVSLSDYEGQPVLLYFHMAVG